MIAVYVPIADSYYISSNNIHRQREGLLGISCANGWPSSSLCLDLNCMVTTSQFPVSPLPE